MHLPSQLKTNELVPSIIQKNIHIFLSAKKEKDIRNVCTNYPFPGVLIVEGSTQREVVSGGKGRKKGKIRSRDTLPLRRVRLRVRVFSILSSARADSRTRVNQRHFGGKTW